MDPSTPPGGEPASRRESPVAQVLKVVLGMTVAAGVAVGAWYVWRTPRVNPVAIHDSEAEEVPDGSDANIEWRSHPEYVGSQACRKCHSEQFESYQQTAHSRTLQKVDPQNEPPDAIFDHPPTGFRYRTTHAGKQLVHEVSLLRKDKAESYPSRFSVKYRFGSERFGRQYLVATDGFLVESPIGWDESRHAWGLAPGIDALNRVPFGGTLPAGCLSCHSGRFETGATNDFQMQVVEASIGCERCHGPGRSHVELEAARKTTAREGELAIVNPQRLPRRLAEAVCGQCHLQGDIHVGGRGFRAENYHPGEPLEKYSQEFRVRDRELAAEAKSHSEQLAKSACYRQSDSLRCTTCHNPHRAVPRNERTAHYRAACLTCHQNQACRVAFPERIEKRQNDCTACHMPAAVTAIPHAATTHHQIGIHPLKNEPIDRKADRLIPLFDLAQLSAGDRQRALGLAWFQLSQRGANEKDPARLSAALRAELLLSMLPAESIDAAVVAGLASLYYKRDALSEAEEAARRALAYEELPTADRASALEILGLACFDQSRFTEAGEQFLQLTRLRRDSSDWFHLGLSEYNAGHFDAARPALETARRMNLRDAKTSQTLIEVYQAQKDVDAEERLRYEIEP